MPRAKNPDERSELLHLAQAFEGLVGALREGHPVPRADLDQATRAATKLWSAAGPEWHAEDFKSARAVMLEHAAGASRGEPRDVSLVERASHRIAQDLRWRAHAVADGERAVENETLVAIEQLDGRYARYAPHPAASVAAM
jgi:hypothetical protein